MPRATNLPKIQYCQYFITYKFAGSREKQFKDMHGDMEIWKLSDILDRINDNR